MGSVRLGTRFIFDDQPAYSITCMAVVLTIIIIGSKKGKLGWFGRNFLASFKRLHSNKRLRVFFVFSAVMMIMAVGNITLVYLGDTTYSHIKVQVFDELQVLGIELDSIDDAMTVNTTIPKDSLQTPAQGKVFVALAVASSIANDLFDGWIEYSWWIILFSEIEINIILLSTRKATLHQ
jgi:hypothetical protein